MPMMALVRWPAAVPLYLSLWVCLSRAPGLLERKNAPIASSLTMTGLAGAGLSLAGVILARNLDRHFDVALR